VRDNLSTPLRVSRVRIEGADNTRKCFLGMLVNPVISPFSENRHTLGSVLHAAKDIAGRLQQTDIFKSVEMRLERSRDPLAQEEDVDIVAKTREKGRFYLKTATEVGNGEGNAVRPVLPPTACTI
jgi:outer membrane protein insertion porin family